MFMSKRVERIAAALVVLWLVTHIQYVTHYETNDTPSMLDHTTTRHLFINWRLL